MGLRDYAAWNHNTYDHPHLLRRLPSPCRCVLDVGCGTGLFASRLAEWADRVDAMDRAPEMIARARTRVPDNVRLIEADLLTADLPPSHYDAITSISALHHMPLDLALARLASALRPGGVLVAIALPRRELPRQLPIELTAALAHRAIAVGVAVRRLRSRPDGTPAGGGWLAKDPGEPAMPSVVHPELSVRQVRRVATAVLPGARVRRLLFWRYLLVWHKPH